MRYMGKDAFTLSGGKKRPRVHHNDFLDFVRSLPCLVCGSHMNVQAAHIRYANLYVGKAQTGARKPDDCWCVPLCSEHHVFGKDAQHSPAGPPEQTWWKQHNIDPLHVAALLWLHFTHEDRIAAMQVALHARELRL